jgi:hypothetical protein
MNGKQKARDRITTTVNIFAMAPEIIGGLRGRNRQVADLAILCTVAESTLR